MNSYVNTLCRGYSRPTQYVGTDAIANKIHCTQAQKEESNPNEQSSICRIGRCPTTTSQFKFARQGILHINIA